MCQKWGTNELKRPFNLVVLVSLREAQRVYCIENVFKNLIAT